MRSLVLVFFLCDPFTVVKSVLDLAKNLVGFVAKYAVDANLFRLGSSIEKHAAFRGTAPVRCVGGEAPPPIFFIQISAKS